MIQIFGRKQLDRNIFWELLYIEQFCDCLFNTQKNIIKAI